MDDPGSMGEIILAILLVMFSAFFSFAETSLTSLGKYKIRSMAEEGKKGAKHVEKAAEDKDRLLSTVLIGGNFSNIALGSLVTAFALSVAGSSAASIAAATGAATVIVLIFGELTPKSIAMKYPEKIALYVARPLRLFMFLLAPVAAVINFIITAILRPFGLTLGKNDNAITETELKTILEFGVEEGVIERDEHKMIDNVMEFDDVPAKDIMTPRTDMVAIDVKLEYAKVLKVFGEAGLSRLPVYQDNIDNIVGVLHIKDFILADNNKFNIKKHMREPFFTIEQKHIHDIFKEMRRANTSLAVVLDEYGGTSGLLSMEDVIEEIVGEIFDEHDEVRSEYEKVGDFEYLVSGAMKIDDFNEMSESALASEEYDSVGGYVMGLAGGIPEKGLTLDDGSISFVVEEMERNRIEKLRIKLSNR